MIEFPKRSIIVVLLLIGLSIFYLSSGRVPRGNENGTDLDIVRTPAAASSSKMPTNVRLEDTNHLAVHRGKLLAAVQNAYPSLRHTNVACDPMLCTITISSRGLIDDREREDIFKVVTGQLDQLVGGMGYVAGKRDVAVYGDDTTIVTLSASITG